LHKNYREGLGVFKYYVDQAHIILANFNVGSSVYGAPEYPMWIYGWLFTLTEDPIIIVLLQMVLAVSTICIFIYTVLANKLTDSKTVNIFSFILLISIPWYALHSIIGPYSVASSLLVLLCIFSARLIQENGKNNLYFFLCWFCLVLLNNTRSEYLFFWLGLILFLSLFRFLNLSLFFRLFTIFIAAMLFIIPWGLYSKNIDNHWHVTAGGGYQALIRSLGQLPNNDWGISFTDDEPQIFDSIKSYYGENVHPFSYKAAIPLRAKFLSLVYENPYEWTKKILWTGFKVITGGAFEGDIYESNREELQNCVTFLKQVRSGGLSYLWAHISDFRCFTIVSSKLFGIAVVFLSYLLLPYSLYIATKSKNFLLTFTVYCMLYQLVISSFILFKTRFTSIIFPFCILNICITANYIYLNYIAPNIYQSTNNHFFPLNSNKKFPYWYICSLSILILATWIAVVINLYQVKSTDIFRGVKYAMTNTVERVISQHPSAVSLFDNGGQWNPPGEETDIFEERGPWTPFQRAVAGGHYYIAKLLLNNGAGPLNAIDQNGLFSVHLAARCGSVPVLKLLEKAGANLHAVVPQGRYLGMTPLHIAAMNGHLDAATYLMRHGVHSDLPDARGFTAAYYAHKNGYWKVHKYLASSN